MYFQRYGIDKIKNPIITRNVFDEEMNQGTNAGKDIAELFNKVKGTNFPLNKVISDKLAVAINNLSSEERKSSGKHGWGTNTAGWTSKRQNER